MIKIQDDEHRRWLKKVVLGNAVLMILCIIAGFFDEWTHTPGGTPGGFAVLVITSMCYAVFATLALKRVW